MIKSKLPRAVVFCLGIGLAAQVGLHAEKDGAPDADNSRTNRVVASSSQWTADQAKNSKTDLQIMSEIRRAVVQDKTLSVYAHNVKIISQHGAVVLKGTVHTQDEKDAIGQKAADVVGDDHLTNNITVKGS